MKAESAKQKWEADPHPIVSFNTASQPPSSFQEANLSPLRLTAPTLENYNLFLNHNYFLSLSFINF